MNRHEIGIKLNKLRTDRGLSLVDAANSLGISPSAMSMYEAGERIPRDEIKIKIADFYKTTVQSLFF